MRFHQAAQRENEVNLIILVEKEQADPENGALSEAGLRGNGVRGEAKRRRDLKLEWRGGEMGVGSDSLGMEGSSGDGKHLGSSGQSCSLWQCALQCIQRNGRPMAALPPFREIFIPASTHLISSHLSRGALPKVVLFLSLSLSLLSQLPQLREEENSQAWTPKKVDSGGKRRGREEKVLGYIQGAWSANENMLTLDKWDELTNNGTFFFFTEHSLIVPRKE